MSETSSYFALPEIRNIFEASAARLRTVIDSLPEDSEDIDRYMLNFIGTMFFHIQKRPELFDERCVFNIGIMGERYTSTADNFNPGDGESRNLLFWCSYRLLIEYQLATVNDLPIDLLGLLDRVHTFQYDGITYAQIKYAEHQMVIHVLQRYLHHPGIVGIRALPEVIERSERERLAVEQMLTEKEAKVMELKSALDQYKHAFNFAGLSEGFKNLRAQKAAEGWFGIVWLFVLGMLMLSPFALKFYLAFHPVEIITIDTPFYVSLVGFELVLAYFFRVALHGYRSVKAQLIQIDLRVTLCQFIQEYAKYAKEVRLDGKELLERFDQLVFSGIVTSEGAIPSTFDGLEQLANLIDKFKSK